MKSFRFTLRHGLVFVAVICLASYFLRPLDWKESLVHALAAADQVVIESNVRGENQHVALESNQDVMKILDAIEIDEGASVASCGCEGSTLLRFSDGKGKEQVDSIHHGKHLRWWDGRWPCDAILTSNSAKALDDILVHYGYRLPAVP